MVGIAGNKDTTNVLYRYLKDKVEVQMVHYPGENISGYQPPEGPAIFMDSYTVPQVPFDVMFVCGWQRLIPEKVLKKTRCYGMHGSPYPLPQGRGRSPLNWAIIQGHRTFTTNLFKYEPGIDDGRIVDSYTFNISSHDTGATLQYKNVVAMMRLLDKYLEPILKGTEPLADQLGEPSYYPKRRPEDGRIVWEQTAEQIHRLIRATTRPFPGARAGDLIIWDALPIDTPGEPGLVKDILCDSWVVGTGSGSLVVTDWSGRDVIIGEVLPSADTAWDFRKLPIPEPDFCSGYREIPQQYRW